MSATTLGDDLPREIARVRDGLIPLYESIGEGGKPAAMLMRHDVDVATKALVDGDVVAMLRAYVSLKEWVL
jgi:hypothetical protein